MWKTDVPEVRLKADTTSAPPGTIVDVTRDTTEAAAGDGRIARRTEIQAEGRRPMNTRDFLAGRTVRPGTKFGS